MRSYKGVCGGTLYWKFNDPIAPNRENMLFPSLMSVIDFYGMPKMAYDYTRRAYEDVILAFREVGTTVQVYGCNETLWRYRGILTLSWMDEKGESKQLSRQQVEIGEDAATLLAVCTQEKTLPCGYLKAEFDGEIQLQNRFFPGDIGDYIGVIPSQTKLNCQIKKKTENSLTLSINTSHFAQDVCLTVLDRDVRYSDNFFDMDANEIKQVTVTMPTKPRGNTILRISALNAASQLILWD